ncbi:MAG: hypothetical protein JOZ41_00045 [Chloroflexi bacterium]|nr:hypothetical protein [Chloroflexota bacterium]
MIGFVPLVEHVYLPLLTQETAIMISAFTYGLEGGATTPILVATNTAAVLTDLVIFFLPTHVLAQRLHRVLASRLQDRYDQGSRLVEKVGAFRSATAMGFVMPSVVAMIVVGLLRLSFWRALAGLFLGSAVYVVIPLLIALPLASSLPRWVVPILPWVAPTLAVVIVAASVIRAVWRRPRT